MGQTARFQETLRRLAMIDEGFVEDEAGLGLGLVKTSALDPKTAALLQVAVSVAIGSPAVCLEWSAGRALAAGASEDEIAGVLLAIAPAADHRRAVRVHLGHRHPRLPESPGAADRVAGGCAGAHHPATGGIPGHLADGPDDGRT